MVNLTVCQECGMGGEEGAYQHKMSCSVRRSQGMARALAKLHQEEDPNGVAQHAPGAKLDAGKVDAELVFESFPNALLAVAKVATFGANKYTRGGWKSVKDGIVRYDAAHMRHKLKRLSGEKLDQDSKLAHRFHEAWNALAALELELMKETE